MLSSASLPSSSLGSSWVTLTCRRSILSARELIREAKVFDWVKISPKMSSAYLPEQRNQLISAQKWHKRSEKLATKDHIPTSERAFPLPQDCWGYMQMAASGDRDTVSIAGHSAYVLQLSLLGKLWRVTKLKAIWIKSKGIIEKMNPAR